MSDVGDVVLEQIRTGYRRTHTTLLDVAAKSDEASFAKALGSANSIAFNLWHVARWDDSLFASAAGAIPEIAGQLGHPHEIWTRDKLRERWGLPAELGGGGAGTGLPKDDAQGLVLPERPILVDYATRVFEEFADRMKRLDEAALARTIPPKNQRSVAHWILYYWEHAARHLGMMEALRGVFGEAGSARG